MNASERYELDSKRNKALCAPDAQILLEILKLAQQDASKTPAQVLEAATAYLSFIVDNILIK